MLTNTLAVDINDIYESQLIACITNNYESAESLDTVEAYALEPYVMLTIPYTCACTVQPLVLHSSMILPVLPHVNVGAYQISIVADSISPAMQQIFNALSITDTSINYVQQTAVKPALSINTAAQNVEHINADTIYIDGSLGATAVPITDVEAETVIVNSVIAADPITNIEAETVIVNSVIAAVPITDVEAETVIANSVQNTHQPCINTFAVNTLSADHATTANLKTFNVDSIEVLTAKRVPLKLLLYSAFNMQYMRTTEYDAADDDDISNAFNRMHRYFHYLEQQSQQ